MVAKDLDQYSMQDMCRRVVQRGGLTGRAVNSELHVLTNLQGSFGDLADMNDQFRQRFPGLDNVNLEAVSTDAANVPCLAA